MRHPPRWLLFSAAAALVFLIGGWTAAAALQPPSYDPLRDTISSLAGLGASDRWVMTAAIALLGMCHVVTALGLGAAAIAGRLVYLTGGFAMLAVCALPLPPTGPSTWHGMAAMVGFLTLALWPALAARRSSTARTDVWALRAGVGVSATAVLFGFLGLFGLTLLTHHWVGLSERVAAGAEGMWPLVVVISYLNGAGVGVPVLRRATARHASRSEPESSPQSTPW
jgi:hypothetical membrane protein